MLAVSSSVPRWAFRHSLPEYSCPDIIGGWYYTALFSDAWAWSPRLAAVWRFPLPCRRGPYRFSKNGCPSVKWLLTSPIGRLYGFDFSHEESRATAVLSPEKRVRRDKNAGIVKSVL